MGGGPLDETRRSQEVLWNFLPSQKRCTNKTNKKEVCIPTTPPMAFPSTSSVAYPRSLSPLRRCPGFLALLVAVLLFLSFQVHTTSLYSSFPHCNGELSTVSENNLLQCTSVGFLPSHSNYQFNATAHDSCSLHQIGSVRMALLWSPDVRVKNSHSVLRPIALI